MLSNPLELPGAPGFARVFFASRLVGERKRSSIKSAYSTTFALAPHPHREHILRVQARKLHLVAWAAERSANFASASIEKHLM